jgi:hypothetical protein
MMILPPAVPLQHLLHRYDGLSPRFEERPGSPKLLTIIPITGIVGPGATVVPVTIATASAIAPLIPGVWPVIASIAVGRAPLHNHASTAARPIDRFDRPDIPNVERRRGSRRYLGHEPVVQVLGACRLCPRHDRKKTDHPGGSASVWRRGCPA